MLKVIIITMVFCWSGLSQASFAAVNLSVNPVDGGSSLRFERIPAGGAENKKEIRIRVSSPNGDRYQVFQRILEPIVNEKGGSLNLQAVSTQTLSNSNSSGTLYLQNLDHMSMGDQLLYSSGQSGESDAFIIGYSLNPGFFNTGGNFRGRLVFTVRGIGNASSDQVTIDVFLEAPSSLKMSIKAAHHPTRIRVQGSDISEKTADFVSISFSGNSGQEIRIYQETETMPQNEMDQPLGPDVLQIDAQGPTEGLRVAGPSPLGPGRTLIYSADKEEDNFLIYFLVNASQAQRQDAGSYVGKIKYVVETNQRRQEFPIRIQCDIIPQLMMNVTTPPGGVSFSHVTQISPPQDIDVLVTVLSNLHKPYQIVQDLQTNMTNRQGKEIKAKYFTMKVEIPSDQKGQSNFMEFTPVPTGEYPVFSSDAQGSGATFKVVYRLQGYSQISAGDFIAPVRLSLNQK
jgi:hypothetical protein